MANNRIFLVNERLDIRISIAKFSPGGWWCGDAVSKLMNDAFERDLDYSIYGRTDWKIEYETDEGDEP
jgi:hypothetical protein